MHSFWGGFWHCAQVFSRKAIRRILTELLDCNRGSVTLPKNTEISKSHYPYNLILIKGNQVIENLR